MMQILQKVCPQAGSSRGRRKPASNPAMQMEQVRAVSAERRLPGDGGAAVAMAGVGPRSGDWGRL